MYCKHCGAEITPGTIFCSHCGKPTESKSKKTVIEWFKEQKQQHQILILAYVFALLLSLAYGFISYDWEVMLWLLFTIILVIPFIVICIYYYRHIFKKSKGKSLADSEQSIISLADFSKEHGKMYVRSIKDSSNDVVDMLCIFSNETQVEFSKSLGKLTPKEISSMKDRLGVKKVGYNKYELVRLTTN